MRKTSRAKATRARDRNKRKSQRKPRTRKAVGPAKTYLTEPHPEVHNLPPKL